MSRRNLFVSAVAIVACLAGGLTLEAQSQTTPKKEPAPAAPTASAPLNLNAATSAQLETLPGIGPAVAARIIEYRQKNGGFKKIEELMNVKGIGEKSFLKLKALVTIAPAKTIEK